MESEILSTPWMEEPSQLSQQELPPLPTTWTTNNNNNNLGGTDPKNDDVPSFNSFLQVDDWFINSTMNHDIGFTSNQNETFLIQPLGPSPSPPSTHAPPSFTPTPFFNLNSNNNPFTNDFDFGSESNLLNSNSSVLMGFNTNTNTDNLQLSSNPEFNPSRGAVELSGRFSNNTMSVVEEQFHGSNSLISNQTNVLQQQAIEVPTPAAQPPTLFQKRRGTALLPGSADKLGALEIRAATRLAAMEEEMERKRKISEVVGAEEGLNDDSDGDDDDDIVEIDKSEGNGNYGGNSFNGNNTNDDSSDVIVNGGIQKVKKKAVPAKNLMAERRRRKKLNDRLYMLRSVVPKISKMDRASILGDAIEYLKDLIQKVNDLQNELGSIPSASSLTPSSFHPVTPTLPMPTLPSRVKDELCLSSLATPNSHSPKVEVRLREGRAINIHMFCASKPGLFLSTMRALDSLGLDVQQAVISCFNGFVLDVFRAEQCRGLNLLPEQIKAVLLQAADFHGVI